MVTSEGIMEGGDRRAARATFALLLFIFLKRDGDACVRTADRLLTALRCVLGGGAGAGVARVRAATMEHKSSPYAFNTALWPGFIHYLSSLHGINGKSRSYRYGPTR